MFVTVTPVDLTSALFISTVLAAWRASNLKAVAVLQQGRRDFGKAEKRSRSPVSEDLASDLKRQKVQTSGQLRCTTFGAAVVMNAAVCC